MIQPSQPYPVLEIPPDAPFTDEHLGSKYKFWLKCLPEWQTLFETTPDNEDPLVLFKEGRPNTGEAWAEKISAEIAALLQLPHAQIELATFEGKRGTCSLSFLNTQQGDTLFHGNELLALIVKGYERECFFNQSDHTYHRVTQIIEELTGQSGLQMFVGYLILDALIGNTDRHHENWGVITHSQDDDLIYHLPPTYDHASSLGRELQEERCHQILQQNNLKRYIRRGRTPFYWHTHDAHGLSPLELIQRASTERPNLYSAWLPVIKNIEIEQISSIFSCIPDGWITNAHISFGTSLVQETRNQLIEILGACQ